MEEKGGEKREEDKRRERKERNKVRIGEQLTDGMYPLLYERRRG